MHINPHASEGEIYEYDIYTKMTNIDTVGFVIHYTPRTPEKLLRRFRDTISTFSVRALAGVELHYPFRKMPRGFDYYLLHFSNVEVDTDILKHLSNMIIAHPFAYGMRISEYVLELLSEKNIALEFNSAHFEEKHIGYYKMAKQRGIQITFGSDAHTPQEIGEGFEKAEGIVNNFQSLKIIRYF